MKNARDMTLREFFAALAMHAELNTAGQSHEAANALNEAAAHAGRAVEAQISFNAYTIADAMMDERDADKLDAQRYRFLCVGPVTAMVWASFRDIANTKEDVDRIVDHARHPADAA